MTESEFPFLSEEEKIHFHTEVISFELNNPSRIRQWIEKVVSEEKCTLTTLTYIFCSDEYLHQLNLEHLQHDTLTDIITFPYSTPPNILGDLFISIDRVRDNADTYAVPFESELHRVMIHGVFHLCGYQDKTEEQQQQMRSKEDAALSLLKI